MDERLRRGFCGLLPRYYPWGIPWDIHCHGTLRGPSDGEPHRKFLGGCHDTLRPMVRAMEYAMGHAMGYPMVKP